MRKFYYLASLTITILKQDINCARNIHRAIDPNIGSIEVSYDNEQKSYKLQDSRLREFPLFKTYNHEYLMNKKIPDSEIPYMYEPEKSIEGKELKKIIDNLLKEIKQGNREFTDFIILKQRDFNFYNKCGLLVLKFKDYPFIFKIFIECPESFAKPELKSFQVRGIFYLGGTFRHIMGYTRLRNIDLIQEKIKDHPMWAEKIKIPTKWFWIPEDNKWLKIKGYNLGGKPEQEIKIPSVYGLLCDEIKEKNKKDCKIKRKYLKLCSYLEFIMDPLPANFLLGNKGEIILIDTEHFAILIGIRKKFREYDKYSEYWPKIAGKYIKDRFFTTKKEQREIQQNCNNLYQLF